MAPPDVSDEHLVMQAQQGDQEAFLILYNRYLNKVYNRVKSRVPLQDAEDVTQEIFIAVLRSLPTFEHRSRFNTWLYTLVNRQIVDFYRRSYRKQEQQVLSLEASHELDLAAENGGEVEIRILMQQAMHHLPENYREVILLRFADGLTFAEIADARQQTLEATKSLYRRAIQALTERVNRKSSGSPGSTTG